MLRDVWCSLDLSLWQPIIEDRAFVPWLVRQPSEQVCSQSHRGCVCVLLFIASVSLTLSFAHETGRAEHLLINTSSAV